MTPPARPIAAVAGNAGEAVAAGVDGMAAVATAIGTGAGMVGACVLGAGLLGAGLVGACVVGASKTGEMAE